MKTGLSKHIRRTAHALPTLSRIALELWAKTTIPRKPPWLLCQIAADLNCRITADAQLFNGMQIRVVWTDLIGSSICVDGYYDLPTVRMIQRLLQPGMTFVDVGAHVGEYTLLASSLVGPTGGVHCFEPQPDTFELLLHNITVNRLTNVHLNSCALAESCRNAQLYIARLDNIGQTSLRRPDNYTGTAIDISCRTLDDYAENRALDRIDLIKIDVEGAELSVLRGAHDILSRRRKPYLILEFWDKFQQEYGSSCAEMTEYLWQYRYELFWISASGLIPYTESTHERPNTFNVLAIPGEVSRNENNYLLASIFNCSEP
jgi:FkbM family methyltransferase